MVFAAIDIGSNAMRLLFCRVYIVDGKPHFNKEELFRMPIRLGEDVFTIGKISDLKTEKLITALKGYSELIKAYGVVSYRAVATSAMRDAANGSQIISRIKSETGLNVEIIDELPEELQKRDFKMNAKFFIALIRQRILLQLSFLNNPCT